MEYTLVAFLVLLVVGGFVTFLVLNVTRGRAAAAARERAPEPDRLRRDERDDKGERARPASERLADRGF